MEHRTSYFNHTPLLALLLATLLVSSCRTSKCISEGISMVCDTTIILKQSVKIDTAEIVIPMQKDSVVSVDSVSVVQTDFAISKARITKEGQLIHTIENKPTKTKAVMRTDTTTQQITIWHKSALHTESETTQEKKQPFNRFYLTLVLFAFTSIFIIRRLYK